jgi:chemotaxis protein CheD
MDHAWTETPAPNVYFDPTFGTEAAKILPGEYYATGRDMLLVTVLGSCVAACIRDPFNGVGGMNHFMLPDGKDAGGASARYGAYAMEVLINDLLKLGARRDRLEAKVFGGGAVMEGMKSMDIGKRNSQFVLGFLGVEGVKIAARDLMDDVARKVYFFPASGRVMVKRFRAMHNDTIVRRETEYKKRLAGVGQGGEVELFA